MGEKHTGWQPIETAPKDRTEVLIFGMWATYPTMHVAQWRQGQWKVDTEDGFWGVDVTPTHWMPLPATPTDTKPAGEGL